MMRCDWTMTAQPSGKALFSVPYLSLDCERCRDLKSADAVTPSIRTTPYRSIRVAWGGDIPFLHELLGTDGHSAIFPCHVCLIKKDKLQTVGVRPSNPPPLRSLATAAEHLKKSTTGRKDTRKERAYSQVDTPIPSTEYKFNISLSPLHVTLGLVKDLVKELKKYATELDVLAIKNRQWFNDSSLQRIPAIRALIKLYRTELSLQRDIDRLESRIASGKRKLVILTPQDMYPEITHHVGTGRYWKAELESKSEQLASTIKSINESDGPFMSLLNHRIDLFGITTRSYFGGDTFIGRDSVRIMTHGTTISNSIRSAQLIDHDDHTVDRGNDELAQKYALLFAKLLQCFQLYSAARPLCSHELQLLEIRSAELASLWPSQFTPKFHLLTYHMPQFARDWLSIGLSTEQCVESSHSIFNELQRRFACITRPIKKLELMAKGFLLQSDSYIPEYSPAQRICPLCHYPIARSELLHCKCRKITRSDANTS